MSGRQHDYFGGGVFNPSGNYFKGQIDDVAVWFRALATNEITALGLLRRRVDPHSVIRIFRASENT